jgi:hypothetical protein
MSDEDQAEEPLFQRVIATAAAEERPMLEAFLEFYRDAAVRKLSGLSDGDARRRLVESQTTLAGLIKHLRAVEMNWFQCILAQTPEDELPVAVSWGNTFALAPTDTIESLIADYRQQCELSRRLARRRQLDDTVPHPARPGLPTLDLPSHDRRNRPPRRARRHPARADRRTNRPMSNCTTT